MIAVDTSALMALLLSEVEADRIEEILANEDRILISAGTLAEARIVAERRDLGSEMRLLIEGLGIEVERLGRAESEAVAAAYSGWGKGLKPAGLNFGDCFAYALSKARGIPLLYVGDDFSKTDVPSAFGERCDGTSTLGISP